MTRATFPGGLYSIALPDGSRIVEYSDRIEVNGSRVERPGNGLLAMVARKFSGFIYIAGQENDNGPGTCWLFTPNGWRTLGPTHGVRPCAFGDDSVFIAISGEKYARVQLNSGITTTHDFHIGSQGIRYVNESNMPVTGDATIGFDPAEFTVRGDVTVGQGHDSGVLVNKRMLGYREDGRFIREGGNCQFVNFERDGDALAVGMVKFLEGQSVLYWLLRHEVDALPLPTDPIDPPPPPPPPPPEPHMSVPNRAAELRTFHQQWNGSQPINGEAEKHRFTAGFAVFLNQKDGSGRWGRKSRAGSGQPLSKDTLAYWLGSQVPTVETDGKIHAFDLITGSTGAVNWSTSAEQGDPLYANIDARWYPVSQVTPPPPDNPPPTDPIPAQIAAITERLEALAGATHLQLQYLDDRITELTNKPAPVVTLPKLRVKGSTSRAFAHAHTIDLEVVPE